LRTIGTRITNWWPAAKFRSNLRSCRTPCEALYKSKKRMIDEGNGRYTPCEAMVKPKKAKKKG
jgi:hypothetical protein